MAIPRIPNTAARDSWPRPLRGSCRDEVTWMIATPPRVTSQHRRSIIPGRVPPTLQCCAVHSWFSKSLRKMLCSNAGGLISSSLSFMLVLTGILSDYWLVNFGSELFHEGIWQRCTNNVCTKITGRDYIDATRSLLILSTALLLFGMVFSCLTFFNYHVGRFTASLAAGTLAVLSTLFLAIGMIVYTSETAHNVLNSSYNFEWSFFLCWTSGLLTILAAISHFLAHQATPQTGYESV